MFTSRRCAAVLTLILPLCFFFALNYWKRPDALKDVDHSLKSEDYSRLGVPSPSSIWSSPDMMQAHNAISGLAQETPERLPRYKSPRSGEVFARITSSDTLPSFRTRGLPVQTRLLQALDYGDALKEILKLYMSAFLKHQVRDVEVVELTGAFLRLLVVELSLVDEFLPTLDKDAPDYEVRMNGLRKQKAALSQIIDGLFTTLSERDHYSNSALIRLLNHMEECLPPMVEHLSQAIRDNTIDRLRSMQDDPSMQDLQPNLAKLLAKIKQTQSRQNDP